MNLNGLGTEVHLLSESIGDDSRPNSKEPFSGYVWAYQSTVKAVVGTGVIVLPYACWNAGWLLSVVGMVIIAVISAHTMQLLVLCMRRVRALRVSSKDHDTLTTSASISNEVTLSDVGQAACGPWGRNLADLILIFCQVTGGMAFVSFILENFTSIMHHTPHNKLITLCAISPILLLLTLLRSTTYLAPAASLGNILFLSSFVMILYFGFSQISLKVDEVEAVEFGGFSKFFGVAIFAFAAHSEVMSIEQFLPVYVQRRYTQVIAISMFTALLLFVSFGLCGYMFFLTHTHDDIFMNISCPNNGHPCKTMSSHTAKILGDTVKGLTTTMVLFNFPYTMFGAVQSIEERIWGVHNSETPHLGVFVDVKRGILRTFTVAVVVLVAGLAKSFGFLTAFSGCLTGLLTFVLPPLFYVFLYGDVLRSPSAPLSVRLSFYANSLLVGLGLIVSLASIVQLVVK